MAKSTGIKKGGPYFYKKVIPIPMYGGNFIILFSNDIPSVCKTCNIEQRHVPNLYAHTFHNFLHGGFESFAVCFNFWDTTPITLGTITHEVTHAGNKLMTSREMTADFENDEAEAYLKGWMADQVQQFMIKCNIQ